MLKHFDELITFGEAVLEKIKASRSYENLAEMERWRTSSLHTLNRIFGGASTYSTSFQGAFSHHRSEHGRLTYGIEIMKGAKEEIERGFLYKLEHLISSDFFDSITEQAGYLLKSGFKDVAAVLGRVVIENTLRDLAKRETITVPEKIKLSDLNQLLRKEGVYAKNVWRTIDAQIDIGNYAAHGHFDKYDTKSVENMLTWIRETLLNM